jgi:molybdopterin-guanine dinucleotide biosynthesis protein A
MNLSAVILAGGQSRRMGRDKAWLEVDGQPLIVRAVEKVRQLGVAEIFISGRPGVDYTALRCPVLLDQESGLGPLGGIERALHECSSPLLLVLAVDLASMTGEFLQKLVAKCDSQTGAVPLFEAELEPLAAIYPKRCHALAVDCLKRRQLTVREFAETCRRKRAVQTASVGQAEAACFANWNSPADLTRPDSGAATQPAGPGTAP